MTNYFSLYSSADLVEMAAAVSTCLILSALYVVVGYYMVRRPDDRLATVAGCTLFLMVPVMLYFTVPLMKVLAGYLLALVAKAIVVVLVVVAVVSYLAGFRQRS